MTPSNSEMKDSSSPLVILVVLICLLSGGLVYFLKSRRDAGEAPITGTGTVQISYAPSDEDWSEVVHLAEESSTLIVEGRRLAADERFMLQAQLVGSKGDLLFTEEFTAGRGFTIRSGGKSSRTEAGPGLVELFCGQSTDGVDMAVQYYRVIQIRVVLVRAEDRQGRLVQGDFGPKVPLRSFEGWETSLASTDPGEVLWALRCLEKGFAGDLARKKIADFTSSRNPWIAEAARAVDR